MSNAQEEHQPQKPKSITDQNTSIVHETPSLAIDLLLSLLPLEQIESLKLLPNIVKLS